MPEIGICRKCRMFMEQMTFFEGSHARCSMMKDWKYHPQDVFMKKRIPNGCCFYVEQMVTKYQKGI